MKKLFLLLALLLTAGKAHAFTDNEWYSYTKNNVIVISSRAFRIDLTLSGTSVWCNTTEDKNALDAQLTSDVIAHSVVPLSINWLEVAVSTTEAFTSMSDFLQTMQVKTYTIAKLLGMMSNLTAYQNYEVQKASGTLISSPLTNANFIIRDTFNQINIMTKYYLSMP